MLHVVHNMFKVNKKDSRIHSLHSELTKLWSRAFRYKTDLKAKQHFSSFYGFEDFNTFKTNVPFLYPLKPLVM